MSQLLFIEVFVFGAAVIAAIYHLVLFIQQRDKFLLCYSSYLFSLAMYIGFKLLSNNYDPFLPTNNVWYYIGEEFLQVWMVTVYVFFAAVTLEVVGKPGIVRTLMYCFFLFSAISIIFHIGNALINGPGVKTHFEYAISRVSLVGIATVALLFAWRIRITIFQRTIIIGSLVYDFSGLLSIISFTQNKSIFGLSGVEPYLAGCLLDIIIFSSALGYRIKMIAEEKNALLKKEISQQLALLNERKRISTELHDDLGAQLSTARMFLNSMKNSSKGGYDNPLVQHSLDLIDTSISDLRKIMDDLQTSTLQQKGYIAATEELVNKINQLQEINFTLSYAGIVHRPPQKTEHNLFRITQELINNSIKYAKAKNVSIDLVNRDNKIILLYEDDGVGFDLESIKKGYGLSNIETRTRAINGILEMDTTPGKGTRTIIEAPLN